MQTETASDVRTGTRGERRHHAATPPPTPTSQGVPQAFREPDHGHWKALLAPFGFTPPYNSHRRFPEDVQHLYFLTFENLTKVGIAVDLAKRMRIFRLGTPRGLQLAHSYRVPYGFARQIERKVHAALADHADGREWFAISPEHAREVARPIIHKARIAHYRLVKAGFADWQ